MTTQPALLPQGLTILGYEGPRIDLNDLGSEPLDQTVVIGGEGYDLHLFEGDPHHGDDYCFYVMLWDKVTHHVVARYGIDDRMGAIQASAWLMELAEHPAVLGIISRREAIRKAQWEEMRLKRGPLSGWHYSAFTGAEEVQTVMEFCGVEVQIKHNGNHPIADRLAQAMAMLVYPTSVIESWQTALVHYERMYSDAVMHREGLDLAAGKWAFPSKCTKQLRDILDAIQDERPIGSAHLIGVRQVQWEFETVVDRIGVMCQALEFESEGERFNPHLGLSDIRQQLINFQRVCGAYLRRVACGLASADELPMGVSALMLGALTEAFEEIHKFEADLNGQEWDRRTLLDLHMQSLTASATPQELRRLLSQALGTPY